MHRRKPVLLVDRDSPASQEAAKLLKDKNIEFVEYDMSKFEESCCGELPTTIAPSVFAPEGVFKGLEGIAQYASIERKDDPLQEPESAYW